MKEFGGLSPLKWSIWGALLQSVYEQARRNGIGVRGANKTKRAPNIIGEKSEPINGRGLPRYFFVCVESMVAEYLKYFGKLSATGKQATKKFLLETQALSINV